jgi:hypothetical protein
MKKSVFQLHDFKIGDQVMFFRNGINDYRMYWTVIGFYEEMLYIEIDENGYKDKLYIDVSDVEKHQKQSF